MGIVSPTGLATDATTAPFIADVISTGTLVSFLDFITNPRIWTDVGNRKFRFAAVVITGGERYAEPRLSFMNKHPLDVVGGANTFTMTPTQISRLNPNTGNLPVFRSSRDAAITLAIYDRHPILVRDGDPDGDPWGLTFGTLFHMSNDSHLFRTQQELADTGAVFDGWAWSKGADEWMPLYEGKMIWHYDHRLSSYALRREGSRDTELPRLSDEMHDDPNVEAGPRYWVEKANLIDSIGGRSSRGWLLGWRDVTGANLNRTFIPCAIPLAAAGDKFLLALSSADPVTLHAIWSSLAFDYVARQKLSGTGMKYFVTKQVAAPTPMTMNATPEWCSEPLSSWLRPRMLELVYTSHRISPYARDLGDLGQPFRWIPERRAMLRAEIDAALFHAYGLSREDVAYVLETFDVLQRTETAELGEFRTRRLVLDRYDAMMRSAQGAVPYESSIEPAPGLGPRHGAS